MKTHTASLRLILAGTVATLLGGLPSAKAANATWNGTTDGVWATGTNWSATPVPGVGNTATFNNAGNGNTTITVGTISLTQVLFDTAGAAAYTLGSGTINFANGNTTAVQRNSTVTANQTINANLTLGTAIASNTTFNNASTTGLLTLGGNITGGTGGTTAAKTLTFTGAGNITVLGNIASGTTAGLVLDKRAGAGTLTLSGTNAFASGFNVGFAGGAGGTVRLASGGSITTAAGVRMLLGLNAGQSGTFTMDAGAGTATFGGNRGSAANYIGVDGGTGTVNANGGTLNFTGMANGSGHLLIGANGGTSNGTMTVAGGTVNVGTRIQMGSGYPADGAAGWVANGNGNATLTISSGAINIGTAAAGDTDTDKGFLYLKSPTGGTGTATVNLDGGTLSLAKFMIGAGGTSRVVNFNGGTVQARASRADFLGTGATLNVKDNGAVIDSNTFDITIAGNLVNGGTGVGGLTKIGVGTMTLSGANTYTGLTTVSAGTLAYGANNVIASGGVTVNGATAILALGASQSDTVGTVTVAGGGSITGSGTSTLTSTGTFEMQSGSVSAILDGSAIALNKTTAGIVTLSGANTYTGATLISDGTLTLSGSGAVNSSSGLTVSGSGAKLWQTSSAAVSPTVTLTQGTLTGSGTVNTVNVGAGTGGIISNNNGVGGAALTIGTLTLAGGANINLFSDGASTAADLIVTTLTNNSAANAVTITAGNPTGWTNGSTYNLIGYTTLNGTGGNNFGQAVNNLTPRQSAIWGDTGSAITLAIVGDSPYWVGDGDDNWNLASTNNWKLVTGGTYTTFLANDVVLFNDNATGAGPITVNINAGNVAQTSTTFDNSTKNYVLSGASGISSGSLLKTGTGSVTIGTVNTYAGATTINAGSVVLSGSGTLGTGSALTLGGGQLDLGGTTGVTVGAVSVTTPAASGDTITNGSLTGTSYAASNTSGNAVISANLLANGAAGFTMSGVGGTVTLSGANTYTGATTLGSGTLIANNATTPLGSAASPLNLNGGTLDLQDIGTAYNTTVGGATTILSNNASSGPGTNKTLGTLSIGAFQLNVAPGANATGSTAAITFGATTLTGAATFDFAANITLNLGAVGGAGGFTKQNSGTLILTGANTFTGPISATGGTVELNSLAGTGAITLDAATFSTTASLSSARPLSLTAGGGTVQVATGTTLTASGLVSGAGSLTKTGDGTLTLSNGASSYTGNISITGGTLLATGTTGGVNPTTGSLGNPQTASRTITVGTGAALSFGNNDILGNHNSTPVVKLVVNGGTITNNGNFFTTLSAVDLNAGTINSIGGANATFPSFALKGPITVGGSAASTISGSGANSQMLVGNNTAGTQTTFDVANVTGDSAADLIVSATLQNNVSNVTIATGILKTGVGTMTLTGANTYTGPTALNGGILALGSAGALGTAGTISFAGGTLQFSAANTADYSARFSGAASQAYSLDTNGQTVTLATALSSAGGSLTKLGNGTLDLTAAQDYDTLNASGGTTNLGGTLGTGTSTINANATLKINASQTLAALNIGNGAVVTLGTPPPAPAPFGGEDLFADWGGAMAGGATQAVPEPGAAALLLSALASLAGLRRRKA